MDEMAAKFNMSPVMYPSLSPVSMLLGPGVVFVFCLFASLYPAMKLYTLRPVEAMRAV
jgi:ABC-type antimicrobial peptide transport system permease subunit